MLIKILVVLVLFTIIGLMGSAMMSLVREESNQDSDKVVKKLTWRIGLSVALFILLFISAALGLIEPHGVLPPQQ